MRYFQHAVDNFHEIVVSFYENAYYLCQKKYAMNTNYLDVLKTRRIELQRELKSIDDILQLYANVQSSVISSVNNGVTTSLPNIRNRRDSSLSSKISTKDLVYKIIHDLGGSALVSQVTAKLREELVNKDEKAINNYARNYVHILKKEGRLDAKLNNDKKFIYTIIK